MGRNTNWHHKHSSPDKSRQRLLFPHLLWNPPRWQEDSPWTHSPLGMGSHPSVGSKTPPLPFPLLLCMEGTDHRGGRFPAPELLNGFLINLDKGRCWQETRGSEWKGEARGFPPPSGVPSPAGSSSHCAACSLCPAPLCCVAPRFWSPNKTLPTC